MPAPPDVCQNDLLNALPPEEHERIAPHLEMVDMPLKRAQEYARPECHHCGDFTGEVADISCGGVGMMEWTISGYLIGFSLGQLLWGSISDRYGRRSSGRPIEEFT